MTPKVLALGLILALTASAGHKTEIGTGENGNDLVQLKAKAILSRDDIKQILGSDLDGYYVLVDVTVTPKDGKEINISRDDFLLWTHKDGDRSTPYVPSQIAGNDVLVVSESSGGGGLMSGSAGPVWGGIPGTGGRPERMGTDGGAVGNVGSSSTEATVGKGGKAQSPLMKTLEAKMLPEKKTAKPLSGLLYFPMEKQKIKDLELIYTTPAGKLSVSFHK